MRRLTWVLAPLLAVLVVTGSASVATARDTSPAPSGSEVSPLTTDAVPLPVSAAARDLPAAVPISLTLTLANPRSAQLAGFLTEVENPQSPEYRHFVTFDQYLERFAPTPGIVESVEATLASSGATHIESTPDRSAVSAILSAASVDRLLGVRLVSYGSLGGLTLYTALGTPELPASLAGEVVGLGGLSDSTTAALDAQAVQLTTAPVRPQTFGPAGFVHDNTSGEDWFVGSDYTQGYGAIALLPGHDSVPNATYPGSVAIATLLVSGYNATVQGNLPPWDPAVIHAYFNGTLAPGWPMPNLTGVPVMVSGVTPPLPGSLGGVNDTTPYETENSLDLEMAGSLAPGASLYNFYFAASVLSGSTTNGDAADYFAMDLAQALAYPYSPEHLAVVSCSFGLPDLNDSLWDSELLTAAATGVTVVAASGDQGNAPDSLTGRSDGQWPVWPASDASDLAGALAVGGVSLSMSGQPSGYYNGSPLNLSYDPEAGSISSVSAWYDTSEGPGYYSGTEGGASTVYPEPLWQFDSAAQPNIVNATIEQGASTLGRSEPDLAMPANLTLATVFANSTDTIFFEILEGTSIAAPVLAGILGDIVAVDSNRSGSWSPLGFIDPEVYSFASYFATHPGAAGDPFSDVTNGGNYVFSATAGWDAATGWGGVEAPELLSALHNQTLLSYIYSGPTPGLPAPSSSTSGTIPWTVIFAIFGVGIVAAVVLVIYESRPSRTRPPPSTGVPWGAQGTTGPLPPAPPGTYPGATYLCPYCGAIRPSEPVRCPQCGAL